MLVVVVKGVEEDTETDPLVAGAKHRAFQSLRLLIKDERMETREETETGDTKIYQYGKVR